MENKIFRGDALKVLKTFPDESINCCMTSPPYWALRNYGVDGQLGLEKTFQEYVMKLCDVFDEVKRVLRKDGTCWINVGDTYAGSGNGSNDYRNESTKNYRTNHELYTGQKSGKTNIPDKSLCNIPARFSIEMQNRGWILRNILIWSKPNCMPCSVKDRFTVDFEYLFFFVKSKKYWFETQYEPHKTEVGPLRNKNEEKYKNLKGQFSEGERSFYGKMGRNKRCVWTITTKPFKGAHFATYPEEIVEIPLNAGCPIGGVVLDPFFGAGTTGLVALKQNKKFIGIELNPEYVKIAEKRLASLLEQKRLS